MLAILSSAVATLSHVAWLVALCLVVATGVGLWQAGKEQAE